MCGVWAVSVRLNRTTRSLTLNPPPNTAAGDGAGGRVGAPSGAAGRRRLWGWARVMGLGYGARVGWGEGWWHTGGG